MNWGVLDEEQKFFFASKIIPLDSAIRALTQKDATLEQLNLLIGTRFEELISQVRPTALSNAAFGVSPGTIWWLRQIPENKLRLDEKTIRNAFGERFFDDHLTAKIWTFREYDETQKAVVVDHVLRNDFRAFRPDDDVIAWIRKRTYEQTSPILREWQLFNLPWSSLSQDLRFQSFKKLVRSEDPTTTLAQFDVLIKSDLPRLQKTIRSQLGDFSRVIVDLPEKLFWIERIPNSQRTKAEKGYLNAYGYGVFDNYHSFIHRLYPSARHFASRPLILKALMADPRVPEEAHWLATFETEMTTLFGPDEYVTIHGSMDNLQDWMISYFYNNQGRLTAIQKSWGWRELAQLQSPDGVDAFHHFTVAIALHK